MLAPKVSNLEIDESGLGAVGVTQGRGDNDSLETSPTLFTTPKIVYIFEKYIALRVPLTPPGKEDSHSLYVLRLLTYVKTSSLG